ncbi:MAG TPA: hypothetical protein PL110_00815 [Candidatus Eremiobacteraeota bacterium]|nr:MAG: hypothetical protein BWY64_00587 [bacterium ADurb.Bin363]HPZ06627.1 hypothetical protein [Candidatus Eremiobacteraeota bacterium]
MKKLSLYINKLIPYRANIYMFLAGFILAIEGIYYSHIKVYAGIVSPPFWKIHWIITHWSLLIPSGISPLLSLILIPVIMELLYIFLKKYRFLKYPLYILFFIIFLNGFALYYNYSVIITVKYLIEYSSMRLPEKMIFRFIKSSSVSPEAKALLLDYSHINIPHSKVYSDFIKDMEKEDINKRIINRLLFLRFIQNESIESPLYEKVISLIPEEKDISYKKLLEFHIEDNLLNLDHSLSYKDNILTSDAEVYACILYHSIITGEEKDNTIKRAINLYRNINPSLYSVRIKELEMRLNKKIVTHPFDLVNFLKNHGEESLSFRELKKIYNYEDSENYLDVIAITSLELGEISSDINLKRDIFEFSLQCYREILKNENNSDIYPYIARIWFNLNEYEKAIKIYNLLSAFRPLTPEEELYLARAYYEGNISRKEALFHYISAFEKMGNKFSPDFFYDMATGAEEAGEYDKALEYWREFLAHREEDPNLKIYVKKKIERLEKEQKNDYNWFYSEVKGDFPLFGERSTSLDSATSLIELMEIHRGYVKVTFFMKHKPLEYIEYDGQVFLYDIKHSSDLSVKHRVTANNGKRTIYISYLSSSDYSYLSFKTFFLPRETYSGIIPARPEVDRYLYILAIPSTISKEKNLILTDEKRISEKPVNGWNILRYDRSGCRFPLLIYLSLSDFSDRRESDFNVNQWRLIGLNKGIFGGFNNILLSFIIAFIPFLWLYRISKRRYLIVIAFSLIFLYYFAVITYNTCTVNYLAERFNFFFLWLILFLIYSLPWGVTLFYIKRISKDKITEIEDSLGFYPLEEVEKFFALSGEEIIQKSFSEDYHEIIVKGKSKFLKKYDLILVRAYNTFSISSRDIEEKIPEALNEKSGSKKIAIIVSLSHLSVENKFSLNRLNKKFPVLSLLMDDIKTALFDEYSGREVEGAGIRNLLRNRIILTEDRVDLYYYTQKVTEPIMFYGRKKDAKTLLSLIRRDINTCVSGLRKIGKSSLQMYLQRELRKSSNLYPVIISLQRSTTEAKGIFLDILEGLKTEIKGKDPEILFPSLNYNKKQEGSPEDFSFLFREDLLSLKKIMPANSRVILFIDEIDLIFPGENNRKNHRDYYTVFTTFRGFSEMDKFLILSVQGFSSSINSVNRFPENFFLSENPVFQFFTEVNLGNLSKEDAFELVTGIGALLGMDYEEEVLQRIYSEAGGHPYLTRLLCSSIVNILKEKKEDVYKVDETILEEAVNYCLANYRDYFTYLDELFSEEDGLKVKELIKGETCREDYRRGVDRFKKLGIINTEDKEKTVISYNLYKRWLEIT